MRKVALALVVTLNSAISMASSAAKTSAKEVLAKGLTMGDGCYGKMVHDINPDLIIEEAFLYAVSTGKQETADKLAGILGTEKFSEPKFLEMLQRKYYCALHDATAKWPSLNAWTVAANFAQVLGDDEAFLLACFQGNGKLGTDTASLMKDGPSARTLQHCMIESLIKNRQNWIQSLFALDKEKPFLQEKPAALSVESHSGLVAAAVQNGSVAYVQTLLEKGQDPNAGRGEALAIAVRHENWPVVELLLKHGARKYYRFGEIYEHVPRAVFSKFKQYKGNHYLDAAVLALYRSVAGPFWGDIPLHKKEARFNLMVEDLKAISYAFGESSIELPTWIKDFADYSYNKRFKVTRFEKHDVLSTAFEALRQSVSKEMSKEELVKRIKALDPEKPLFGKALIEALRQ